jgi:hypothetical protein
MTTWQYHVYAAEIVERWSEKKQAEEVVGDPIASHRRSIPE